MNPDNNHPDGHAPPVSPEDDWRDLDQLSSSQQTALPQRRTERGIPIRREPFFPSMRRRSPDSEPGGDGGADAAEPLADGSATLAASTLPNTAPAPGAEIKGEAAPAGSPSDDPLANDALAADPKDYRIARPVTAPYGGNKHFRVNEIKAQRPDDRRVPKTPPKISKRAGKAVSNDALMPGGQPDGGNAGAADMKGFPISLVWTAMAGAGVILIVVAAILMSRPGRGGGDPGKQSAFGNITPDGIDKEAGFKGGEALDSLINGEVRAKGIFSTYATSKSVGNFIGTVYKGGENSEIIAGRWKPLGMVPGWKPDDNCTWIVMEEGGVQFGVLSGFLADSSGFNAVFRLEGGHMRMDWKATTGYGSADYTALKQGLGDGSEIRAILSPGDFHTFALSEDEYRSYTLMAPDRQEWVWGYTKLDGAYDVLLHSRFLPSELTGEMMGEIPVILALERGAAESLPNQWMIKAVRLGWLDE
jgi:hypothetical protein